MEINNPRPPKRWWDKVYRNVKMAYSHATARHPRITGKRRLSQITASIWWKIKPSTRARLIKYYDELARANPVGAEEIRSIARDLDAEKSPDPEHFDHPYSHEEVFWLLTKMYGSDYVDKLSEKEMTLVRRYMNNRRGWMSNPSGMIHWNKLSVGERQYLLRQCGLPLSMAHVKWSELFPFARVQIESHVSQYSHRSNGIAGNPIAPFHGATFPAEAGMVFGLNPIPQKWWNDTMTRVRRQYPHLKSPAVRRVTTSLWLSR